MVAVRVSILALGVAASWALLAPLAAAAEPQQQQLSLYLHRDGALDGRVPVAPEAAAWVFGLAGADEVRFETPPLPEAWIVHAPAVLTFTVALELGLNSGIAGILDAGGAPFAAASVPGPLVPGAQEVSLTFLDFRETIPAGERIGLTLIAAPALDLGTLGIDLGESPPGTVAVRDGGVLAPLGLSLNDVVVDVPGNVGGTLDGVTGLLGLDLGLGDLLRSLGLPGINVNPQLPDPAGLPPLEGSLVGAVIYDAASHPARLQMVREIPAPPAPVDPAPAPTPDTPLDPPDPDDGGGAGPAPVVPIGGGALGGLAPSWDPLMLLVGTGTAAIAALSGLVLRGRDVLG